MVQAIASAAGSAAQSGASPVASLQANLVRSKKELSECVNCASAETPAGRAKIQAISNRIGAIKARLDEINLARSNDGAGGTTGGTTSVAVAVPTPARTGGSTGGPVGGLVNTFA